MKPLLLICSLLILSRSATSQEISPDSAKTYPLKEIVITATRSEKHPLEVGKSISIISQEQLKNSYFNTLSDVVSSNEGLYIVGAGQNFGTNQSIFLRGSNSYQTAVMIDDIRITDPSSVNNSPNISELSLANIERVEIVSGLNSALYGSSAIGGVINMLSKKRQANGFNAMMGFNAGTFGKSTSLFSEELFLNYTTPLGIYANIDINNSDINGIDATIDTVSTPDTFKKRDRDRFHHRDLVGKIGFTNDMVDVYGSYRRTDEKTDLDKRAYVDDDNYKMELSRNMFTYGIKYSMQKSLDVKYVGGYSNMIRNAVDDSSVVDALGNNDHTYSDERYEGSIFTNELQFHIELPAFELLLGGGLYREAMSSRLYYYSRSMFGVYEYKTDLDSLDLHTSTNSIFIHTNIDGKLITHDLEDFSLTLGGRLLKHTSFGTKFLYEINPSYKVNSSSLLFASIATGFSAPSLYQLYSPNTDVVSGIIRGNKYLKPEYSSSIEIGFKQSINDVIEYGVSYFNTRTRDLIEFVYLWDKNIGIDTLGNDWMRNDYRGDTYLNLGDQMVHGIEFNFHSHIHRKITVSGNVCLVDGKINYHPTDVDKSVTQGHHVQIFNNGAFMNKEAEYLGLVRRPSTANLSFIYSPYDRLSLRTDMKYVGKRGDVYYDSNLGPYGALGTTPVADYTLVDVASKYEFNNGINIGMKVENIFNVKYVEIKGFSTRGRGIYLNLRYSVNY